MASYLYVEQVAGVRLPGENKTTGLSGLAGILAYYGHKFWSDGQIYHYDIFLERSDKKSKSTLSGCAHLVYWIIPLCSKNNNNNLHYRVTSFTLVIIKLY